MMLSGQTYTVSAGETFDSVSLNVYGDEKYSPYLLASNPETSEKLVFEGGEILRLPIVDLSSEMNLIKAPWKE